MNIGVTGPNGRLGSELVDRWECTPIYTRLSDLKPEEVSDFDVIINCAAYTYVDLCETDDGQKKATKSNLWGVENLRTVFNGYLIHLSTDYVFDCLKGPYDEKVVRFSPVNMYGWTKWTGEIILLNPSPENENKKTTIVRTTGLYGGTSRHSSFASMIIEALKENKNISVTAELLGNQTYIPHLAEGIIKMIKANLNFPIIHIASSDIISRYEFALMIANIFGLDRSRLNPCQNSDIPGWIAMRPSRGGLKTSLAKKNHIPIYSVLDGLKAYRDDTRKI